MVFTVVAATTNTTLRFGFRNDHDYFTLDNVTVTPLPAPAIQSVAAVGGTVELTWTGVVGLSYQLQYKTNLTQTSWVTLSSITATSGTTTTSDMPGSDDIRYYRILAP
jgi:hypothetical protein